MLLQLKNVSKHYQVGTTLIKALDDISLNVDQGEFLAVMGPSGSGKSTFLQVASILSSPTAGQILLKGEDVSQYNEIQQSLLRNREIGFVFQQFNLLPKTSALENVALPLFYARVNEKDRALRAKKMLELVGLADRLENNPAQLSGGQQQRVAIARALVNNPSLIFADEPTGNLDSKSGKDVMGLLTKLHEQGKTIVMVTHEDDIAAYAKKTIHFQDGKICPAKSNHTQRKQGKRNKKTSKK